MSKRGHDEYLDSIRASKRQRSSTVDQLSDLSDELVLRVFSFLTDSELVLCQR